MKFKRITVDPEVCSGKPCIRGLRFLSPGFLDFYLPGRQKNPY